MAINRKFLKFTLAIAATLAANAACDAASVLAQPPANIVLNGQGRAGDWTTNKPGQVHLVTTADLPAPYTTKSAAEGPQVVSRPAGAHLDVPAGFKVDEFIAGLQNPRELRTAPNGDLFVAESSAGIVRVIRPRASGSEIEHNEVFLSDLKGPFGMAFYPAGLNPQYLFIGDTDGVVRVPYKNGDLHAAAKPEKITDFPTSGHWTRDVIAAPDEKKLLVSVGSASNDNEGSEQPPPERAAVLEMNPDGSGRRVFADGLRNPVSLAIRPQSNEIWTTVNERDGLGDDLVPDYFMHISDGDFFGWPWYYLGATLDPRHQDSRPDLRARVKIPQVLLQSHSAPLGFAFYTGTSFPKEYQGDAFIALHGSWNRSTRTGYKVVRALFRDGHPTGEYADFLTGFLTSSQEVWGRPVGVAVLKDGSLVVSDDGGNCIWRVSKTSP